MSDIEVDPESEGHRVSPARRLGATRAERLLYWICRIPAVGGSRMMFPGSVIGLEHLPKHGAYVLAPVHRSNVDWLVVARVTRRRLRYLVKAEVWRYPRVGAFIERLGALPVNREAADRESFNRSLAALEGGEPLVVFPEGTRREGGEVAELHEGAAYLALRTRVPIVPVGLAGTERAMPRGKKLPRPSRVRIVIGEPIPTLSLEGSGRVPRSRVRSVTDELRAAIQHATDNANALLRLSQGERLASPGNSGHGAIEHGARTDGEPGE